MNKLGYLILMTLTQEVIAQGTWTQKASVFTNPRAGVIGFSIGNKGYLGCGWKWDVGTFYNEFWEWDQLSNSWTQKADFAGTPRGDAVAFSIGNKGYTLTGEIAVGGGVYATNELWEWDQVANVWSQKAIFPGAMRAYAAAFSIGSKGYVGCGYNSTLGMLNDFWEYDQLNDSWTQKTSIPIGRGMCVAFSIGNLGFIGTGLLTVNDPLFSDLWEYNPSLNAWTQKANFPGGGRDFASGFSIGNMGFLGTGWDSLENSHSDFWRFNPATNLWTQMTSYPHLVTDIDHAGFSIGCKGYFGTGATAPSFGAPYYNDFWEFEPDTCSLTGIPVNTNNQLTLTIIPNPFSEKINISVNNADPSEIIIYNRDAKVILHKKFIKSISLNTKSLAKGIYLYEVRNKNGVMKKGKILKD